MRIAARILLGFVVAILLLLIVAISCEIGFRVMHKYPTTGLAYSSHEVYKWMHNLHTKDWSSETNGFYQVCTDDYGFRNCDKNYKPDTNTIKILVIGDSYTAGLTHPFDQLWTTILERNLNAGNISKKHIQVYNMASPAWGTEQEFICLKSDGMLIKPDYVLLMTCPNDIRETYSKKIARLTEYGINFYYPHFRFREKIGWKLANRSCLFQYLQTNLFETNYGTFEFLCGKMNFNFGEHDSTCWDCPMYMKQEFTQLTNAWNLYGRLVDSMQGICAANHIGFAVSCVPMLLEFDKTFASDSNLQAGWVSHKINNYCQNRSIAYINMYNVFAADTNPISLFRKDDEHFTTRGMRLAGQSVTEYYKEALRQQH